MKTIKKLIGTKTLFKIALIMILALSYTCTGQRYASGYGDRGYVSFQVFYDQLSPYGDWINYPEYGYVWIPDVGYDFEPYATAGYWVMTNYGWTWVSQYPWGWAPFHYGRWDFDRRIGWIWIPGSEWGPAWVTWRRSNGYYGWAPLRPGISVSMSFNLGYNDFDHWCFVRDRDFGRHDIYRYYIDRRDFGPIVRNLVVINNTYVDNRRHITYVSGPRKDEVQRYTGRRVSSMSVRDDIRPGQNINNNQIRIYRPRVENIGNTGSRPAPSRLSDINNIKPREQRETNQQRNVIIPQDNSNREERQSVPQQRYEPRRSELPNQPDVQPQRRYEPGPRRNDQSNIQRQERSQQLQQNQQSTQQRREMRRAERSQRRLEMQQPRNQQQPYNSPQQNAAPQSSDQNKAGQQQNEQGTTGPGRRR